MLRRTLRPKRNIEGFFDRLISRTEGMERAHGLPPKKSLELKQAKVDAHRVSIAQSIPEIADILSKIRLSSQANG
jgi:hypothetical protein